MDEERLLRKYNNNLVTCGTGIIMFTIWSVLKGVVYFADYRGFDVDLDDSVPINLVTVTVTILLIAIIPLFIAQFYVGRRSIKMGKGTSNKKGFIGIAIFLLIFSSFSIFSFVSACTFDDIISNAVSIIIEISQDCLLIDILVNFVKIQLLLKKKKDIIMLKEE